MANKDFPLLSVIVPIYNTEKYLARCLDSILCQTYENLEILCINDGSTDRSGEILDFYSLKDSRIIILAQQNIGLAKTRNRGIAESHGQYLAFVDSDDYIHPSMYKTMLEYLLEAKADVCICQWESDNSRPTEPENSHYYGVHQSLDFFRLYYLKDSYTNIAVGSLCNKVFRREVIINARAEFKYSEDQEINDQVYCQNCKVVVLPKPFYYYFNNPSSINHKPWPGETFNFLDVLNKRRTTYQDKDIIRDTEILYCNMYMEYWMRAHALNIKMPTRYNGFFRQICLRLLTKHCDMKFYARLGLFLISPTFYTKIVSYRWKV